MANTAFLFVPGAWCPGFYNHKVTDKLQALGYHAVYVDLPSSGKKDDAPGLQEDASHVRTHAAAILDSGSNLVIAGNSYGAFVAQEACEGLTKASRPDGSHVCHIVIIASFFARKGQTMKDLVDGQVPIPEDNEWLEAPPGDAAYKAFFSSLSEDEGLKYGNMLREQSTRALVEPLTFAAWETVPTTMVVAGKDLALKPQTQSESFEDAQKTGIKGLRKVVLADGEHVTMLSSPDDIVDVCVGIAGVDAE
ncbi:uncharacterized protein N0V89_005390 [Didymosphaeria variabile]|uniref:AB hydrolase-1 domain-containing protein n=1 Tax=Didymosphaeria variabile TaxID=1932322 RepID=A0A9W9CB85_9PLEO|nr:uncharacterized protein N0V89_005390 [Didymosphaeria variabile]KAJ4353660.1 hypothetical protein N0V89_005390 [Didymosphaeria variabile]